MKQRSIVFVLLLTMAGTATAQKQRSAGETIAKVKINLAAGKTLTYKVSQIESIEFVEVPMGEHEWVDLGLPSGTLWATCNVGAETPEDSGYLIAWGETEPKETYSWDTYRYYEGGVVTKYNASDGLTELEPEDDAATANWGSDWKTPTKEQFDELISNTTNQRITVNGQSVCCFTSKVEGYTDQFIILPFCPTSDGGTGDYWVSTHYSEKYPYHLSAWFVSWYTDDYRCIGNSVRPVRK